MSPSRETVRLLIDRIAEEFAAAGIFFGHGTERAIDEAAWLVGRVLGLDPADLADHLDDRPDTAQVATIEEIADRRIATRKPLAYLINEAWFAGYRFYVDERVIVPRSLAAEVILDRFEPWIDAAKVTRIVDLCTGSGCMAIVAAHMFPQAKVDAVDLSPDALAVARINVERHGVADRVRLIESDLFGNISGERYDVIVTNPPYVAEAELAALPAEYGHEPAMALAAGADGLAIIARILTDAADHLNETGILVVEVGNSQRALSERFPQVPFTWLATTAEDDSVFLLTAVQLKACRHELTTTA